MNAADTFAPATTVTCPCCSKECKTTKTGAITRHGYSRRMGGVTWIDCPASRTTSIQAALTAAVDAADEALQAALRTAADKPYPRHMQAVESAARNVADARKAAGLN